MLHFLWILCGVLALLLSILVALIIYGMGYWRRRGIAHRRPDFFYGNLKGVMQYRHFADIFQEIYEQFKGTGPFAGLYMLFDAAALILDLDLIKRILITDFAHFSDRGFFYNERDDPLTAHIFALPSAEWRQLRAKISPAFTAGKLKLMYTTIQEVSQRLVEAFEQQVEHKGACVLELKDWCDRYTTDVIGTCIFGLECNSLQDPSTEFRAMNQNLFDNPRNHRAVDGLLYAFPRLSRHLRLKQIPDVTSDFYFHIVKETMAYRRRNNIRRGDLMTIFMDLQAQNELTFNEIVANAFLFFFAGFETSSTTMTLALYELAQHAEYQERARREIMQNLAEHDNHLSYECIQSLPYLDQIINETMRKHTIIPNLQRKALADYPTSNPKDYIAKGTTIIIPVHAIHHDALIYPEPERFLPERFASDALKKRHSLAWIPFGEGPRSCVGVSLARVQMRLGLATLLRHFKFTAVARTPQKLNYYMQCPFLVPKHNIFLQVERV